MQTEGSYYSMLVGDIAFVFNDLTLLISIRELIWPVGNTISCEGFPGYLSRTSCKPGK